MEEEREAIRRFADQSRRAYSRGIPTQTPFLTLGEQTLLSQEKLPLAPVFFGGFDEAERKIACFGEGETGETLEEKGIALLEIAPKNRKFAADLCHRDFLGSILSLGIKRELIGDILVWENTGYAFVLKHIAPFVAEHLEKVHNTPVSVQPLSALPESVSVKTEEREIIAASPRVDAVISALWRLSREEGRKLVEKEKVSVAGRLCKSPAKELSPGDRVSVQGKGRFYFLGSVDQTPKGRERMKVRVFIS